MQQEPKITGGDIRLDEDNKFLKWLDNYWYHYKWHTIIIGFFALMILFTLRQCANDATHDTVVAYCGPTEFMSEQTEGMRDALEAVLPEDFDGDGQKYVEIVRYLYYSEQEIEAKKELYDDQWTIAPAYVNQQLADFRDFVHLSIAANECSIYFISPSVYAFFTTNPFRPLADVLDTVPNSAHDAHTVRLGDTALYKNDIRLQQILPADTLVCLLASNRPNDQDYQNSIAAFRAIVAE